MKINIKTKYSIDDMVFMPKIVDPDGCGAVDIASRKIKKIVISHSKGPLTILYEIQGGSTRREDQLFKSPDEALEAGTAELVAKRLEDDEWGKDDDDEENGAFEDFSIVVPRGNMHSVKCQAAKGIGKCTCKIDLVDAEDGGPPQKGFKTKPVKSKAKGRRRHRA